MVLLYYVRYLIKNKSKSYFKYLLKITFYLFIYEFCVIHIGYFYMIFYLKENCIYGEFIKEILFMLYNFKKTEQEVKEHFPIYWYYFNIFMDFVGLCIIYKVISSFYFGYKEFKKEYYKNDKKVR